jgi:hypothetical protein
VPFSVTIRTLHVPSKLCFVAEMGAVEAEKPEAVSRAKPVRAEAAI